MPDKWLLSDITQYQISNDGIFIDINKFKTMDILQGEAAQNAFTLMTYSVKKEREINNRDLHNYIKQRLVGFTIAIGSIFLYYITLPFFDLLAEKGVLHPFITAIFPPFAFLCAIIAFYKSKDL